MEENIALISQNRAENIDQNHVREIVLISQSRVENLDENHVREICNSKTKRNIFLEKATFFGNRNLTKFLLLKLKENWGEEQLKKAFTNAVMSDDVKVVKIVLDKCRSSGVDVETTDMKELAKKRGKSEILKLLDIPFEHKPPVLEITKHSEFEYVDVMNDIIKMIKKGKNNESNKTKLTFDQMIDHLLLKKIHYETENCPENCKQKFLCKKARYTIHLLEFIVKEISKKFKIFEGVQIQMIGSIKEETRIGTIDEADTILLHSEEKEKILKDILEYNRMEQKLKVRRRKFNNDTKQWISLELPDELKPFISTERLSAIDVEQYYGLFDESKYFKVFIDEFCQVIRDHPVIPEIPGLKLTLNYTPCAICEDSTNIVKKHVRCRHRPGCEEHKKIRTHENYQEQCDCREFSSPSLSYSKIGYKSHLSLTVSMFVFLGLTLHAEFCGNTSKDKPLNLDIDVR